MAEVHPITSRRSPHATPADAWASGFLARAGLERRLVRQRIDRTLLPPEVAEWAELAQDGGNLLLAGPPGGGKTVSAVAAVRLYLEQHQVEREHGHSEIRLARVLGWWHEVDLWERIFARDRDALRRAATVDLLVLDDLGTAHQHPYPVGELLGILDHRSRACLPTIATTNVHPVALERRCAKLLDRLDADPGPGLVLLDRPSLRRRRRG